MLSLKKSRLYLAMISLVVVVAFGSFQDTHAYGFDGPYADFGYGAGYDGPYADFGYGAGYDGPYADFGYGAGYDGPYADFGYGAGYDGPYADFGYGAGYDGPYADFGYGAGYDGPYADFGYGAGYDGPYADFGYGAGYDGPYADFGYGAGYDGPYADFGYGAGYDGPYADYGYSEQPIRNQGFLGGSAGKNIVDENGVPNIETMRNLELRRKQRVIQRVRQSERRKSRAEWDRENRTRAVQSTYRDMRLKNPAPSRPLNSREQIEAMRTEVRYRRNNPRSSPKIRVNPSVTNIDRINEIRKR